MPGPEQTPLPVGSVLASVPDLPRHEVERLLLTATGWRRTDLVGSSLVGSDALTVFDALVAERRSGVPLQYLEGTVAFGPLELAIDRRALIPRPETEHLWDLLVGELQPPPSIVVDLCTGSGNLALACKHAWPEAEVWATDLSPDAAELARENSAVTGLAVTVLVGDLFDPLPTTLAGHVDLVVANPPYLAQTELGALPDEVRIHEPTMALVAGPAGTEVLARIAEQARNWLRPGGTVACEISEFHAATVAALFGDYTPRIIADLAHRPRVVIGRRRA